LNDDDDDDRTTKMGFLYDILCLYGNFLS